MILLYHKYAYKTRLFTPPIPIICLSKTEHIPLICPTLMAHKQDSTQKLDCQLTGLSDFDYLLDKSNLEADGDDARADDLTRRQYDKWLKTKSIQKAAERV